MTDGTKVKRERTCIGCGRKSGKDSLHRIVRDPDGSVRFDARGNAAGRGAYICSQECLDKALAGGKLQRALRVPLKPEDVERIGSEMKTACAVEEE